MNQYSEILKGCKKKKPMTAAQKLDMYGILKGKKPHNEGAESPDEEEGEGEEHNKKKTKKGNPYHDPETGKFTTASGAGAPAGYHPEQSSDSVPRSDKEQEQHLRDLESDNWHTRTMAKMKDRSDDSLRFIYRDASLAARANPQGSKSGQYLDEAHYASMELTSRQKYRKARSEEAWSSKDRLPGESEQNYAARRMAQALMEDNPKMTREQAIAAESKNYTQNLERILQGKKPKLIKMR